MKRKAVQIWVDPDFKKGLRVFAAREDLSIMDASKKISKTINEKEDQNEKPFKLRPKYRI